MAHIKVQEGVPGIRSLVMYRPETGQHLFALAQTLLRDSTSTLSDSEREIIAAYVSSRNNCTFCTLSHAAAARYLLPTDNKRLVDFVLEDYQSANISDKLKSLLDIAGKVQINGKEVKTMDVLAAKGHGATEREIHDTVLIAAAFSMFNRYVDGLAAFTPVHEEDYVGMGERMGEKGYVMPPPAVSN